MGEAFSVKDTVSTGGGVSVNVPKRPKGNLESMKRSMERREQIEAEDRANYEKNMSNETIDLVNSSVMAQVKDNNTQPVQHSTVMMAPPKVDPIEDVEEEKTVPVRVKRVPVEEMDVEEAIMQMELLDHSFFIFKDYSSGVISVVYKREEGGYGVIEAV